MCPRQSKASVAEAALTAASIPTRDALEQLIRESAELIADNQRRLREHMARKPGYSDRDSAQAQRLGRAVAALAAQARQYDKDNRKWASATTFEEKCDAVVSFFTNELPVEHRRLLIERLATAAV